MLTEQRRKIRVRKSHPHHKEYTTADPRMETWIPSSRMDKNYDNEFILLKTGTLAPPMNPTVHGCSHNPKE